MKSCSPSSSPSHAGAFKDREPEARYGAPPNPGRGGMPRGGFGGPRGGFAGRGGYGFAGPGFGGPPAMGAPGTQLYIGNVSWRALIG